MAGWILENYHYLKASSRHVANAIAACPDELLRNELVHHLDEETEHGNILRHALDEFGIPTVVERCRPLPTTSAFVGYLEDLARHDWKAYCLGVYFLQTTLNPGSERHQSFYKVAMAASPDAGPLVEAMRRHDSIDDELGHQEDATRLISLLITRHDIGETTLQRAALVPMLTWSFLDGIEQAYAENMMAIAQRVGWKGL